MFLWFPKNSFNVIFFILTEIYLYFFDLQIKSKSSINAKMSQICYGLLYEKYETFEKLKILNLKMMLDRCKHLGERSFRSYAENYDLYDDFVRFCNPK